VYYTIRTCTGVVKVCYFVYRFCRQELLPCHVWWYQILQEDDALAYP